MSNDNLVLSNYVKQAITPPRQKVKCEHNGFSFRGGTSLYLCICL